MHALAWTLWLVSGTVLALACSNPLYLTLLLLTAVIGLRSAPEQPGQASFAVMLKAGLVVALIGVAISALANAGGPTVLFTLPEIPLPDWLGGLSLGGEVSAEALAVAATRGLALTCAISLFAVFVSRVRMERVLRLAPAAVLQPALILTIGLSILPSALKTIRDVRDAQRLRGHRFRGWRDLAPLIVPVTSSALERSYQLAEAMEARGYGRREQPTSLAMQAVGLAAVLGAAFGAFGWFYYPDRTPWFGLLLAASVGALAFWVRAAGSGARRSNYRPEHWEAYSLGIALLSVGAAAAVLAGRAAGLGDLAYNPYPVISAPEFSPLFALVYLSPLAAVLAEMQVADPRRARGRRPAAVVQTAGSPLQGGADGR
jgi:energy-coupling factor transport system permease protein